MIRSLEKNKDRLGLLPQKKQKEMCIRETGSGRKVQVLRLLTWENNRTWGPMKVPRATNARWCEIKARVSAESENRFYAHVPVNGCTLTARELSSCLSFLVFFPQSLTEIILWHTFPSTPDGPIHHYQHCQPPWSFSNIQRPSAAISFSLLLSTWFYCKSRSWLMSGVYHTSISSLLGYFGGVQHLKWTLHSLLQDTEERWAHTTQEMNKETLKCKFKKEKGTSNENLFLKWQSWVTSPCYASLLRDNSHLILFPTFHKSIRLRYKLMSIAGLTLPKCMSL